MGSAYFEIQQFASFERGAQHVSPFDGACARRRAGEKQVARAVGDVARDVAQQFVHPEDHVARRLQNRRKSNRNKKAHS